MGSLGWLFFTKCLLLFFYLHVVYWVVRRSVWFRFILEPALALPFCFALYPFLFFFFSFFFFSLLVSVDLGGSGITLSLFPFFFFFFFFSRASIAIRFLSKNIFTGGV